MIKSRRPLASAGLCWQSGNAPLERISGIVISGCGWVTGDHEGVDQGFIGGCERALQGAEILLPLILVRGPAITDVTSRLFSTQATANWPAVTPRSSAWLLSCCAITKDSAATPSVRFADHRGPPWCHPAA